MSFFDVVSGFNDVMGHAGGAAGAIGTADAAVQGAKSFVPALAAGGRLGGAAQGLNAFANSPFMAGAGGLLGAYSFGSGLVNTITGGTGESGSDRNQGVLDMVSGGLGVAAGLGGLGLGGAGLAAAMPVLGPAAAVAGLGAYGNKFAQDNGWYGTHTDENGNEVNSTFFGSIGETASDTYGAVSDALGGGVAGTVLGGLAGGITGAGQTLWNSGAAVVGGLARGGSAIISGIGSVGSAIISFLSDESLKSEIRTIESPFELLDALDRP